MRKIAADRNYKAAFQINGQEVATSQEVEAAKKELSDRLVKVERILQELWAWKNRRVQELTGE